MDKKYRVLKCTCDCSDKDTNCGTVGGFDEQLGEDMSYHEAQQLTMKTQSTGGVWFIGMDIPLLDEDEVPYKINERKDNPIDEFLL